MTLSPTWLVGRNLIHLVSASFYSKFHIKSSHHCLLLYLKVVSVGWFCAVAVRHFPLARLEAIHRQRASCVHWRGVELTQLPPKNLNVSFVTHADHQTTAFWMLASHTRNSCFFHAIIYCGLILLVAQTHLQNHNFQSLIFHQSIEE